MWKGRGTPVGAPRGIIKHFFLHRRFLFGEAGRATIIMFMTEAALANFQRTDGWKVGVDGSIAIITVGAGGQIDTNSISSPVIGFIFDQKGLMYNLTLGGSKISRIQR